MLTLPRGRWFANSPPVTRPVASQAQLPEVHEVAVPEQAEAKLSEGVTIPDTNALWCVLMRPQGRHGVSPHHDTSTSRCSGLQKHK